MAVHYSDLLLVERNMGLELQPSWLLNKLWTLQIWGLLRLDPASGGIWGAEPLSQVHSLARLKQLKNLWSDGFQRVVIPQ